MWGSLGLDSRSVSWVYIGLDSRWFSWVCGAALVWTQGGLPGCMGQPGSGLKVDVGQPGSGLKVG